MVFSGPIFTEDGSHLYRFAFLAAMETLKTVRKWRNEIEQVGPDALDLSQASRELRERLRRLDYWLFPMVADGDPVDPWADTDWRELPNRVRVRLTEALVKSRGGAFSALGFSGQSAFDVVQKLADATHRAVSFLVNV